MKHRWNRKAQFLGMLTGIIFVGLFVWASNLRAVDYRSLVKEPNGGDILYTGNTYTIRWDDTLLPPQNTLEIWLQKNTEVGVRDVLKITEVRNDSRSYQWAIPASIEDSAVYSISVRAKELINVADSSDFSLAILQEKPQGTMEFITPKAGETWGSETSRIISWRSHVPQTLSLKIFSGNTLKYETSYDPSGIYNRNFPVNSSKSDTEIAVHTVWPLKNTPSGTYRIEVLADASQISRDITIVQPILTLTSPKGGEQWAAGETRTIQWQAGAVNEVGIALYRNDQPFRTLFPRTNAANGAAAWTIPVDLPAGDAYAIRVYDLASGAFSVSPWFSVKNDARPMLMKAGADPKVYAIQRSRRHWIPSVPVFNSYGYKWDNVAIVAKGELERHPRAKLLQVAGSEKVYYLTESGMKRHIPNPTVFASYGNKWDDIIIINQLELDTYPDSVLIRAQGDAKVYKLENGQKRWIKTLEAFNRHRFDWANVAPVNNVELDTYPTGSVIQ